MSDKLKPVLDGIKQGAVKQVIDQVVDSVSGPAVDKMLESFGLDKDEASGQLSETAIKFIIMLGLAEGIGALGPSLGGVIGGDDGDIEEKSRLLSEYMKKYAGEKVGAEAVTAAIKILPQVTRDLWKIDSRDLKNALGEGEKTETVPSLFEEECNSNKDEEEKAVEDAEERQQ